MSEQTGSEPDGNNEQPFNYKSYNDIPLFLSAYCKGNTFINWIVKWKNKSLISLLAIISIVIIYLYNIIDINDSIVYALGLFSTLGFILFLISAKSNDKIAKLTNVFYLLFYCVLLFFLFSLSRTSDLNKYGFLITPLSLIVLAYLTHKTLSTVFYNPEDIQYEKYKMLIVLFCLVMTMINYYVNDPGGYIHKYMGASYSFTIAISMLSLAYLFVTLFSDTNFLVGEYDPNVKIWRYFFLLTIFGMALIAFTKYNIFSETKNNLNYAEKKELTGLMIFMTFIFLIVSFFYTISVPQSEGNTSWTDKLISSQKAFKILLKILISGVTICAIVYNVVSYTGIDSFISIFLNVFVITAVLGIIYKLVYAKSPEIYNKKNYLHEYIKEYIFYIPCLLTNIIDNTIENVKGKQSSHVESLVVIISVTLITIAYSLYPFLYNNLSKQNGNVLINKPINLKNQHLLGTFDEISDNTDLYKYNFGISSWIFINSYSTSTSLAYNKDISIMNFANKPNILYNSKTNELKIETIVENNDIANKDNKNKSEKNVLHIEPNIKLQKWNHIVVNGDNGHLDIFINNKLIFSKEGIDNTYNSLDGLYVGDMNGIDALVANVVYFKSPLDSSQITSIYNKYKAKNPPFQNKDTII